MEGILREIQLKEPTFPQQSRVLLVGAGKVADTGAEEDSNNSLTEIGSLRS